MQNKFSGWTIPLMLVMVKKLCLWFTKSMPFLIIKFFICQIVYFNLSNSEKLPCWLKTRIAANARSGNVLATACRPGRSANVKEEKAAAGQHCRRGWSQRSERAAHAGQPQESAKPQLHPRRGNWQQLHPTKSFFFSLLDFFSGPSRLQKAFLWQNALIEDYSISKFNMHLYILIIICKRIYK